MEETQRNLIPSEQSSKAHALLQKWAVLGIDERRQVVRSTGSKLAWVEVPVDLCTFIESPMFLGHPPLSPIQFEAVYESSELFDVTAVQSNLLKAELRENQHVEVVLVWGKGAGKDTCSMIMIARVLYWLGCLTDPQGFFGVPSHSGIDLLNIAVSSAQADGVFFDPLKRLIRSSPWFMNRLRVKIQDSVIHAPPVIGYDPDIGDLYAVNAWSGNSSQEGLEGKNLLLAVLDEIDAFRELEFSQGGNKIVGAVTANSMYDMAMSSTQSRFPGVGKVALLSWPRYYGSFIMKRLEAGKHDPHVFTSGPHATWDVNPARSIDEFAAEIERNPERAKAKYMAQPGRAVAGYFSNSLLVLRAFHARMNDEFEIIRDDANPGVEPPVDWDLMQVRSECMAPPDPNASYCWHVDLALKHDRAAVAMAHHSGQIEDMNSETVPVITLDMLFWWEAPEGGEIDFEEIGKFILAFAQAGYKTKVVTLDGFQSAYFVQIMKRYDMYGRKMRYKRDGTPIGEPIDADYLSTDVNTKVYDTLKELVYGTGRLVAFFCSLVVNELLSLVFIRGGKKVDHPSAGSKDASDAVAGAVYNAVCNLSESVMPSYRGEKTGTVVVGAKRGGEWGIDDGRATIYGDSDRPKVFG